MSLVFLHTADWQLGKPFARIRDEAKRHRVQQERLQAIQRLADLVKESDAAFVLVAGDLFDSSQATKATVSAACAAIGKLKVPVYVIPGNHDHGGPDSIWEQRFFQQEQQQLAPNLHLLLTPEPLILDNAILFPAPLMRRHEPGDPIAWLCTAIDDPALPSDLPRIVLAHGSVQGFGSRDDEENPSTAANLLDLSRLPADAIDYIALGDWHGTKQVGDKAWYSGTPEIDRFPKGDSNDPGNVLQVTLDRGAVPQVNPLRSAHLAWTELAFRFSDDASLDLFVAQMDEAIGQKGDQHLLLLTLDGSLGIEASRQLEEILEAWQARLLRLKLRNHVTVAPSDDEIAALTQRVDDPLIAAVAGQLVAQIQLPSEDNEESAIARLALRELHTACQTPS